MSKNNNNLSSISDVKIVSSDINEKSARSRAKAFAKRLGKAAINISIVGSIGIGFGLYNIGKGIVNTTPEMHKSTNITVDNIKDHLSAESWVMNESYMNQNVLMVSQKDPNLSFILANLDESIKPIYDEDGIDNFINKYALSVYHLIHGGDYNDTLSYGHLTKDMSGPHAYSKFIDNDKDKLKVCYIKPFPVDINKTNDFNGQSGSKVFLSAYEVLSYVKHHEESHCLDFDEASDYVVKPNEESNKPEVELVEDTLQGESLADIYAGLRSIRTTGNLDTVKYTILPFRAMMNHDPGHQSTVLLEKFISEFTDFDKVSKMSDNELYAYAQNYYSNNSVEKNKIEREEYAEAEGIFKIFSPLGSKIKDAVNVFDDTDYEYNLDDLFERKEALNVIQAQQALLQKGADYGRNLIQTYVDHLNYHQQFDNYDVLVSLAKLIHKTAIFEQDKDIEKESLLAMKSPDLLIDVMKLVDNAGYDTKPVNMRYLSNYEALKQDYEKLKDRISVIETELENDSYSKKSELILNHNPKARQKLIDRFNSLKDSAPTY